MEKLKNQTRFVSNQEQTIISFLKENFQLTPLSLIHKLLRTKKILVDNVPVRYYQHRLKKGSSVIVNDSLSLSKKKKLIRPISPKVGFEIAYEDKNIIVVIKDHWIETHNKKIPDLSLDNSVSHYLLNSPDFEIDERMAISSSHRIDKLTKGLVVYPKNLSSKKILHNSFGKKESIEKKYIAVCKGKLNDKFFGEIFGYVEKDEEKKKMIFSYNKISDKSKSCSMSLEKLASNFDFHVFEIILLTGRKHQIRSFFSSIKMPIIGDEKYGSSIKLKNKIKLFAYKIEFIDMIGHLQYLNGKKIEIPNLKKLIIYQILSSKENVLPKKFINYR